MNPALAPSRRAAPWLLRMLRWRDVWQRFLIRRVVGGVHNHDEGLRFTDCGGCRVEWEAGV